MTLLTETSAIGLGRRSGVLLNNVICFRTVTGKSTNKISNILLWHVITKKSCHVIKICTEHPNFWDSISTTFSQQSLQINLQLDAITTVHCLFITSPVKWQTYVLRGWHKNVKIWLKLVTRFTLWKKNFGNKPSSSQFYQPLTHKSAEIKVQFETNAASFDQCILRGKNAL